MRRNTARTALDALRDAALDHLAEPAEPVEPVGPSSGTDFPPAEPASRKPRPVDPAIAALFPPDTTTVHDLVGVAAKAWREATDREAPSIDRLAVPGTLVRIDADAASGYLAVVTADDTWRAFLPREQLATVVALLVRRPVDQVARELGQGPGPIAPCNFSDQRPSPAG